MSLKVLIENAVAQVVMSCTRCILEGYSQTDYIKGIIARLNEVLEDMENGEV